MSMNKSALLDEMCRKSGLKKADAEKALDAFTETIGETLRKGDPVALVGFGTFSVRTRKPRMGRNPQTGQSIHIAGGRTPAFKPGKGLKDKLK